MTVREILPGDRRGAAALWQAAFGDTQADIDAFFTHFGGWAAGLAALEGGHIVAAGYRIPVGHLITGGVRRRCDMLYAIATAEAARGRGLGAGITRALFEKSSAEAVVLHPATPGLFEFYGERTPFQTGFYAYEATLSGAARSAESPIVPRPVSPGVYHVLREARLAGTDHIEMGLHGLAYQSALMKGAGGGFFELFMGEKSAGCATVERRDGSEVWIKELLCDASLLPDAAAALAGKYPGAEITLRTHVPAEMPGLRRRPFGMIAHKENPADRTDFGWFGLALD